MARCEYCGDEYEPRRSTQRYCKPAHARRASNDRRRESDTVLFLTPLRYETLTIDNLRDGQRVAIVNDLQIPFHDKPVLEAVEKCINDWMPDIEIYAGDILDFYEISAFDKNPSRTFNLQDELNMGRAWLERRANANPNARRILIQGNHEDRLRRWLWRHGRELSSLRALELENLLMLSELGVETLTYGGRVNLMGLVVEHGRRTSTGGVYSNMVAHLNARDVGGSGLCGHTHRLHIYRFTDARGIHAYYENGCLCLLTPEYIPFPNWQQGFSYGVIKAGMLHLVQVPIYAHCFYAEGEFYPVLRRGRT